MQTDSYFFIGKTHSICQDYATSNHNSIVVCDGCSGSENSDFGSRILANLFIKTGINFNGLYEEDYIELLAIIRRANVIADKLSLHNFSLDSTVLFAQENEDTIDVLVIGDGTLVVISEDNKLDITDISFPSGAPRYLNYFNNEERNKQYLYQFGDVRVIKREDAITMSHDWFYINSIPKKDNKLILLMSDGVHSFQKSVITDTGRVNEPISYKEVIDKVIDIRGFGGKFIERRLAWFKNKDMVKLGWENLDDFSISAMFLGN